MNQLWVVFHLSDAENGDAGLAKAAADYFVLRLCHTREDLVLPYHMEIYAAFK